MKRMLFPVILTMLLLAACGGSDESLAVKGGRPAEAAEGEQQAAQPETDAMQKPELPEVQAGDCGAGLGAGASLALCEFTDTNLTGTNLAGADIAQAVFLENNLTEADFSDTTAVGTVWNGCNLTGANFSGADLTLADLSDNNLMDSTFVSANLSYAVLTGVNASNADFTGADLTGADFSGANLTGAVLSDAQLEQAIVTGAVLPDGSIGN